MPNLVRFRQPKLSLHHRGLHPVLGRVKLVSPTHNECAPWGSPLVLGMRNLSFASPERMSTMLVRPLTATPQVVGSNGILTLSVGPEMLLAKRNGACVKKRWGVGGRSGGSARVLSGGCRVGPVGARLLRGVRWEPRNPSWHGQPSLQTIRGPTGRCRGCGKHQARAHPCAAHAPPMRPSCAGRAPELF